MLSNQFVNFERVICSELVEKAALLPVPNPTYFKETVGSLKQNAKDIAERIDALSGKKYNTYSEYQKKVESLLNKLDRVKCNEFEIDFEAVVTSPDSWHALIEEIATILCELLDHLLMKYWKKCDHFGLLPEFAVKHFHLSRTEMLEKELAQIPEGTHCYEAFRLLLIPMDDWADEVSSMQFHYFDKLISRVRNILKEIEDDKTKAAKIRALLWRMNFNHPVYANMIVEELKPKAVDLDKKQVVNEYTRLIREVKKKKHDRMDWDYGLYHRIGSLKQQVDIMLGNEMIMLKTLMLTKSLVVSRKESNYKMDSFLPESKVEDIIRLFSGKNVHFPLEREELLRVFLHFFCYQEGNYMPQTQ